VLIDESAAMTAAAGCAFDVVKLLARDIPKRSAELGIEPNRFVASWKQIVESSDVDVVVALMGGIEPERTAIAAALEAGKHVVTANKAVLAKHGRELQAIAVKAGRALLFEGAVGGGTPILRTLSTSLVTADITRVQGILNGTCNFILSRLNDGEPFDAALAEAQRMGLAEADPTLDIGGHDTAQKLILTTAMGTARWIDEASLPTTGIQLVRPDDLAAAASLRSTLALIAEAGRLTLADGTEAWEASVEPCLVPRTSLMAHLAREANAVALLARHGGPFFLAARGAGGEPTSMAVLGDLVAVAQGRWRHEEHGRLMNAKPQTVSAHGTFSLGRYMVRLEDDDAIARLIELAGGIFQQVPAFPLHAVMVHPTKRAVATEMAQRASATGESPVLMRIAEPFI